MEHCEASRKIYQRQPEKEVIGRRVYTLRDLLRGERRIPRGTRAVIVGKRGCYTPETPPGEKCGDKTGINSLHPDHPAPEGLDMPKGKRKSTIYKVGRFYLVPEVRAVWGIPTRQNTTTGEVHYPPHPCWWAALGPLHNDVQFLGFRHERCHINPRFTPEGVWHDERFRNPAPRYATTPISYVWPEGADAQVMIDDIDPQAPLPPWYRLRRRKRLRTQADYPDEWARSRSWHAAPWSPLTATRRWGRRGYVRIMAPI